MTRFSIKCLLASLIAGLVCTATAQADDVPVLIRYSKAPQKEHRDRVRNKRGVVHNTFKVVPVISATVSEHEVEALLESADVVSVEYDGVIEAHAEIDATWGLTRIGCAPVFGGTYTGATAPAYGTGVKVAIIDSGIDYNHPDLAANYAGGYDFVNSDADPLDDYGHGTHVAGTVAAVRNDTGVLGVAPGARLYGLKVLSSAGSGVWSSVIAALDWCVANQIAVANVSLGSTSYPGGSVEAAFWNAQQAGVVIVASAGNSGPGVDTVNYPGKFSSVIAVGSIDYTSNASTFSSTGPAVAISAPGSDIYSTGMGGGYLVQSGTSMAAPHVSGVAALMVGGGLIDQNANGLINDEVRSILTSTAEDLGPAGRDDTFGYGLVDAEAAMVVVAGLVPPPPPPPPRDPIFLAPSNLAATLASRTVTLNWSDNSDCETGVEVQYGTVKSGVVTWKAWSTTAANATSFTGSLPKGSYRFRVRAATGNPATYTDWSNKVSLTIR